MSAVESNKTFGIDRKWIVAIAVTFGTMMGAIDASIVNVALSQIRSSVGATTQEITWISTGFSIATVLVMPLTGFLGRMFGQKRVYLFCLVLFILGSALCGISWSLWSLVLFRVIQGLGAGALQPTEQAILRQTFPPEEQGTAMALFTVAVMVGPAFGPTLGGFIVDNFHWSWIFFINIPVGLIGLVMVSRFVVEPEDLKAAMRIEAEKQRKNMDWLGIALLWTSLIAIQYVLEEGQADDWFESEQIVIVTLIGIFGIIAFVVRELTAPVPAVNLSLFKDRTFTTGTLATASVMAVMMSGMFLLPMFMQEFLGFTATQSGLALMPRTIVMVIAMPVVGKLYNRFPPSVFAGAGLLIAAYAQYTLASLTLESGQHQVLFAIMLQGLGMSMLLVPMSTIALSKIPRTKLADATGLSSLLRQVGGSLGLAAMSTLLARWGVVSVDTLKTQISMDRPEVSGRFAQTVAAGLQSGMDINGAQAMAARAFAGTVTKQGMVLAFEQTFTVGAILLLAAFPLMLLLRKPPADAAKPDHIDIEV